MVLSRRFKIYVCYGVSVCVISFSILEIAIRVLHLAPPPDSQYGDNVPDEFLPYKPRPFSTVSGRSSTDEFNYVYTHNSFGFRDVEHSLEKRDGVFRILGLGDSFAYGAGAKFEETFFFRLEQMLNQREGEHPKVEIIKAGMSRFFPEPERLLLQHHGLKYNPDLVIVAFGPNDIIDTYLGMEAVTIDKSGYLKTREAAQLGSMGTFFFSEFPLLEDNPKEIY